MSQAKIKALIDLHCFMFRYNRHCAYGNCIGGCGKCKEHKHLAKEIDEMKEGENG